MEKSNIKLLIIGVFLGSWHIWVVNLRVLFLWWVQVLRVTRVSHTQRLRRQRAKAWNFRGRLL